MKQNNLRLPTMEIQKKQDQCCSFCDFSCGPKSVLEAHMRKHTREKPFYCDQCKRGFSSKSYLKVHIKSLHYDELSEKYEKKHKCSLCLFSTRSKCKLEEHIRTHTGERVFPCQHANCNYSGRSLDMLRRHTAHRHTTERRFVCPVTNCGYRGQTNNALRLHSVKHSECRPFVCDFKGCNYRTKRSGGLKRHKLTIHNSSGHKPFACSICDFRTTINCNLRRHVLTHETKKSVNCTFSGCIFSCKTKLNLTLHVLNCHTEKEFKCDFANCHFSTANRAMLSKHKKQVHSAKPYKCPQCDYRGATRWYLRLHILNHRTSQKIPCPIKGCTFQAINQRSLKRHLQLHEANLNCPVDGCGYVRNSISSSAWKGHMRTHDPTGRSFHCPLCPKHFLRNRELSSHLYKHTREKPFKCPICSYGFTNKLGVTTHVRSAHSAIIPEFAFDEESICDHCGVNFGCTVGLAMHGIQLKTAVVVLTRLKLKFVS